MKIKLPALFEYLKLDLKKLFLVAKKRYDVLCE